MHHQQLEGCRQGHGMLRQEPTAEVLPGSGIYSLGCLIPWQEFSTKLSALRFNKPLSYPFPLSAVIIDGVLHVSISLQQFLCHLADMGIFLEKIVYVLLVILV